MKRKTIALLLLVPVLIFFSLIASVFVVNEYEETIETLFAIYFYYVLIIFPDTINSMSSDLKDVPNYVSKTLNSLTVSDPIPSEIAYTNNEFAIDFYRQISDNNNNQFFSPLSMYAAFSMLYEGARGNSASQLQDAFYFEPDEDIRIDHMSQMISSINRQDSFATLELANAMWLVDNFSPSLSYTDTIRNTYLAHIENVDKIDGADIINQWASDTTNEKITEVISPDDLADAVMVLTNAVYFKGTWVTQFDPSDTRNGTFWKDAQNSVETEFMNLDESIFNYVSTDGIRILKMPYEGDRLSMLVLLPNERDGINNLETMLSAKKLQEWQKSLNSTDVTVKIPKFTMEVEYNLKDILSRLGVKDIFDDTVADLSDIADGIFVSQATQKAFVDVNEEGTEAAAVTTIVLTEETPRIESFIADHPFIFIIQDDESGAILFMGKISDPS